MLRGGRPRDPIWQHFYLLEDGDKKSAQCKKCLRFQSIKACRVKTHYEKCSATAIVKQPDSNVPEKLATNYYITNHFLILFLFHQCHLNSL